MRGSSGSGSRARAVLALALLVGAAALLVSSELAVAARPPVDPASRLPDGDDASEYWDVTAEFDSGHRLFCRWMITNVGPGKHNAIAIGNLVFPDGRVVPFDNGRLNGRWELSDDGRRIHIGSSILDQSGPEGHIEIDKNQAGIRIDLTFALGVRGESGADVGPGGIGFDLLATDAPVHGTLWVRGMDAPLAVRGKLAATHAWMNEYESQLALRRIEFFAPGDALAIYLSDVLTPKGDHQRRLVIERGGDVVLSTDHFELDVDPAPNADDDYPLPGVLRISSPRVEGEIHIGRVLVAHDPMRALPQPLRFLLSFKSRPHRVWVDSAYELRVNDLPVDAASGGDHTSVGGSTRALRGSGITNITFTNPLPDHSDHGGAVTGPSLRRPGA